MTELQDFFSIDRRLLEAAQQAEDACKADFERIEKNAAYNSAKVLAAFQKSRVSEPCFYGTTGYGYGDQGREVLDQVFAEAFGAEDALVRHNFVSGTHALTVALFGVLRTGDKMVALTGRPYDTLEGVIGLTGDAKSGSLQNFGVQYEEIPLLADGTPDYDAVADAVQGARVAYIQRSRGYSLRPALTIAQIRRLAEIVRRANPEAVIMVDNCYGEFVETQEPVQADCDLMIGSMIKNVGGGIARTGGYIAGRKDLVQQCAERLTCIGMGKEVGCTLDMNREMYLGFFHAPETTAQALKTADFAAALFGSFGFACYPRVGETRGDIVEAIRLGDEARLTAFCQGIQQGSPVDSYGGVGHAGIYQQGHHGSRCVHHGRIHRAVRRCPHSGAVRRLDAGRYHLQQRQDRDSAGSAEAAGAGTDHAVRPEKYSQFFGKSLTKNYRNRKNSIRSVTNGYNFRRFHGNLQKNS